MATSNAVGSKIARLNASGDVLTGDVPCSMIIWDARTVASNGVMTMTDSGGTVVLVMVADNMSNYVGVVYPKVVIQNPTIASMTGGSVILYKGSGEWNWNW